MLFFVGDDVIIAEAGDVFLGLVDMTCTGFVTETILECGPSERLQICPSSIP